MSRYWSRLGAIPPTVAASTIAALAMQAIARCNQLAQQSEHDGALTRTFLSQPMQQVHVLVRQWMETAGLEVRIDAIGNIIGRKTSAASHAKTLIIGSHLDTVPNAGRFDGILGVMLGIALAEALQGQSLVFHLDVIGFSEEEGVRFKTPFFGSKAIVGQFEPAFLALEDVAGHSLAKVLTDFGLDPGQISNAAYDMSKVLGYFEVHIEQGPVLEAQNQALAAVGGIAGQSRFDLTFIGRAAHAGTTPMYLRHDALAAAAELVLAAEQLAQATGGLAATVGQCNVIGGAGNIVPGRVITTLDVRHIDQVQRQYAINQLLETAQMAAERRQVQLQITPTLNQASAIFDQQLTGQLTRVLTDLGHAGEPLTSGAGHDAMVFAPLCPTSMLFIRSPGGISHHPDEAVIENDVIAALEVMVEFLQRL
jgi:allantoate deiminase